MTDFERATRFEDAGIARREAEIQGMNGVLEIDESFPLVYFAEPTLSRVRLDNRPGQRLHAA